MSLKPGTPCWIELMTSDRGRAAAFYTSVFGWTVTEPNPQFGGYSNFLVDGRMVAGLMPAQPGSPADLWSSYFAAPDCAAALKRAVELGATDMFGAHPVGDLGVFAFLVDPTGAAFGLWQGKQHQGFPMDFPVNSPLWFELYTRDLEGAVKFYAELFGARAEQVYNDDHMRYTTLTVGDAATSQMGLMDANKWMPAGMPPHWSVYIKVADVDATCAAAQKHGGTVVDAAMDTPYGRMATIADPNGSRLKVMVPVPRSA